MSEHTPKTWHMQDRYCKRGISGIDIVDDKDGSLICCLPDGASIKGGYAFPKQLANARLIAAAPELLEALKRTIPWLCKAHAERVNEMCVMPDDLPMAIKQAQYVISKATGEDA